MMFGVPAGGKPLFSHVRSKQHPASRYAYTRARVLFALFLAVAFVYFYVPRWNIRHHKIAFSRGPDISKLSSTQMQTQMMYNTASMSEDCSRQYDLTYLTDMVSSRYEVCELSKDASQFSCFNNYVDPLHENSFCMASYMTTNIQKTGLEFACRPSNSTPPSFYDYAQDTGVSSILKDFAKLTLPELVGSCVNSDASSHTVLLKRGDPMNLWISLLEIFSYTITLDTLRMTNNSLGSPSLSEEELRSVQVMVIDDKPRGPYIGLLHLLSPMPILFAHELPEVNTTCFKNVIIPLPGASSPLLGKTATRCISSQTLTIFVKRIFGFYHLAIDRPPSSPISIVFVDEKGKQRLSDAQKLLTMVKMKFRDVEIKMADFTNMPFRDQLVMMRDTDILVGLHETGLANAMFLAPRSTVVEITKRYLFP